MIYDESILKALSDLLLELEKYTSQSSQLMYTEFNSQDELNNYVKGLRSQLEQQDINLIGELQVAFLPTSTFQELALSNGWGSDYLLLADKLDKILSTTGYKQSKGPDKRP